MIKERNVVYVSEIHGMLKENIDIELISKTTGLSKKKSELLWKNTIVFIIKIYFSTFNLNTKKYNVFGDYYEKNKN